MPRVIGIDPGTVSIDICGLDDGRVFLDESLPTSEALRDATAFVARLQAAGPIDLIVGPSGYGLPCIRASDVSDADLRLAVLAAEGESGGIRVDPRPRRVAPEVVNLGAHDAPGAPIIVERTGRKRQQPPLLGVVEHPVEVLEIRDERE